MEAAAILSRQSLSEWREMLCFGPEELHWTGLLTRPFLRISNGSPEGMKRESRHLDIVVDLVYLLEDRTACICDKQQLVDDSLTLVASFDKGGDSDLCLPGRAP